MGKRSSPPDTPGPIFFAAHAILIGLEIQHGKNGRLEVSGVGSVCEDDMSIGKGGVTDEKVGDVLFGLGVFSQAD